MAYTIDLVQKIYEARLLEDQNAGVPSDHRCRLRWGYKPAQRTDYSVLMLHGLYNSPAVFSSLEDIFSAQSMNILMTRLKGHWEADRTVMARTIRWQMWLDQVEQEFQLAQCLGKKVILVGQSTGGLLATWFALKHPEIVQALVLFVPAFGVHKFSLNGARIGKLTGYSPIRKSGKILVGHAGLEVHQGTQDFWNWISSQSTDVESFISTQLSKTPVFTATTDWDVVIQNSKIQKFMKILKENNPYNTARVDFQLSYLDFIRHDAVTLSSNPRLPELKTKLGKFLNSIAN